MNSNSLGAAGPSSSSKASNRFCCESCDESFPTLKGLEGHCNRKHPGREGDYKFAVGYLNFLKREYNNDGEKEPPKCREHFDCTVCNKSYVLKRSLALHYANIHRLHEFDVAKLMAKWNKPRAPVRKSDDSKKPRSNANEDSEVSRYSKIKNRQTSAIQEKGVARHQAVVGIASDDIQFIQEVSGKDPLDHFKRPVGTVDEKKLEEVAEVAKSEDGDAKMVPVETTEDVKNEKTNMSAKSELVNMDAKMVLLETNGEAKNEKTDISAKPELVNVDAKTERASGNYETENETDEQPEEAGLKKYIASLFEKRSFHLSQIEEHQLAKTIVDFELKTALLKMRRLRGEFRCDENGEQNVLEENDMKMLIDLTAGPRKPNC